MPQIETNDRFKAAYHLLQRGGELTIKYRKFDRCYLLSGKNAVENDRKYSAGEGLVNPFALKNTLETLEWLEHLAYQPIDEGEGFVKIQVF